MHTICNQEQLTMIDMEPSLTFHYFIDTVSLIILLTTVNKIF